MRGKASIWMLAAALALLVALFAVAGTAVAQVEGVNNEADVCVDESCNSGNVAEVEVDGGGLAVLVGVNVIGGGGITLNDAFNTSVNITQTQVGTPDPISIPGMPAVSGVNNLAATCAENSCNSGNVTDVDVDNGLEISIGLLLDLLGGRIGVTDEGGVQAQQIDDGLLEIELPCTIVSIGVAVIDGGGIDVNSVCNSDVSVWQSQA